KTIVTTLRATASGDGRAASGAPQESEKRTSARFALPPAAAVMAASRLPRARRGGVRVSRPNEEGARSVQRSTLDREQPQLRRHAAPGREPAELAAGRDDAVTRDDDRKGIPAERPPHVAGRAAISQPRGDLAVGERGAGRDRARHRVDASL